MVSFLGLAGAFIPVLSVKVTFYWSSAGISKGYTIVKTNTTMQ